MPKAESDWRAQFGLQTINQTTTHNRCDCPIDDKDALKKESPNMKGICKRNLIRRRSSEP